MKSSTSIIIIALVWAYLGFSYYPKWEKPWSEATISWDVSGYYHYLPAIFIYHDIKQQNWMNDINSKYLPSPAYDQAFGHHDSGNKVNKYAIGQAVLYSPFFFAAPPIKKRPQSRISTCQRLKPLALHLITDRSSIKFILSGQRPVSLSLI